VSSIARGIKLIELIPPLPTISVQQFHDHWRHPYGTMAMNLRMIGRYIQGHRIESDLIEPNLTIFEGAAEAWLDSFSTVESIFSYPYYVEHSRDDEGLRADSENLVILLTHEEVIQGSRFAPGADRHDADWSDNHRGTWIKLLQSIHTDESWSREDDTELGYRIGAFRHVRNHRCVGSEQYVGVRELSWPTLTGFERGMKADPPKLLRV